MISRGHATDLMGFYPTRFFPKGRLGGRALYPKGGKSLFFESYQELITSMIRTCFLDRERREKKITLASCYARAEEDFNCKTCLIKELGFSDVCKKALKNSLKVATVWKWKLAKLNGGRGSVEVFGKRYRVETPNCRNS